jgi:hypothetical protein
MGFQQKKKFIILYFSILLQCIVQWGLQVMLCHRAQQPNIQNTTRNRQQIAAQNRQTTKKTQTDKHTRKETTKLTKKNSAENTNKKHIYIYVTVQKFHK